MDKVKIFQLPGKAVHKAGDFVGVAWHTREEKKTITGQDGIIYSAQILTRIVKPHIDLISIRGTEGDYWEDEDSPIAGGFDAQLAEQIIRELQWAIEYIRVING